MRVALKEFYVSQYVRVKHNRRINRLIGNHKRAARSLILLSVASAFTPRPVLHHLELSLRRLDS